MKILIEILSLASYDQKKSIYFFCLLLVLVSFFEVLSIGMVIPLSLMLSDPDFFYNIDQIFAKFNIQPSKNPLILQTSILFVFILAFIIKFIFAIVLITKKNKFIYQLRGNWQKNVFFNYLNKDYSFFYNKNQSSLILNCINHIDNFTQNGLLGIMEFLTEAFVLFSLLTLLLFIEPIGCIFVFIISLLFYLIYGYLTKKKIKKLGIQRSLSENDLYTNAEETLSGLKEIFLYQKKEYFFDKFRLSSDVFTKSNYKHQTLIDLPRFLLELLAVLCFVTLVLILLISNNLSSTVLTKLAVFAAVTFKLLPSLNRLSVSLSKIRYGSSSFELIKNDVILDVNTKNNEFSKKHSDLSFEYFLELKNIKFSYLNKNVLSNINIRINKNSIIGIEGDSGSGKTTLANIISGLLRPQKGSLLVDGISLKKNNINSWAAKIGYIPQDIFLLEDTIKNNVVFFTPCNTKEHQRRLVNIYKKTNLISFVNKFEKKFNTVIFKNPNNLSGGQIQRIAIARALYKGSDIIIFDEATSALDLKNQKKVLKIVKDLKKEKTIIIISHQKFIHSVCDSVYKISNGKMRLIKK
jgi:ABC-type multidrug transport system fused ATPase/permease subunit